MTDRLYYEDGALTSFEAVVRQCTPAEGRFDVRLDRSAFYPTSGGQPHDTGLLDGRRVVEVIDRGPEGVAHLVEAPIEPGARVHGEVDAARRRDHREQHSGQHVLSAAFARVCGAATVGFHMGSDVSTIDLEREVSAAAIEDAEREANRVVREDRVVAVRFVDESEAGAMGLRRPPKTTGRIRVVEVTDFDRSACGGTHVARTGEIGAIAVIATEKVRGGTRLTFVCGERAERAGRADRGALTEAARLLGVGAGDVPVHVARLVEANRRLSREAGALRHELAGLRTPAWRAAARTVGGWRVVLREEPDADAGALKAMAQAVVGEPGFVAVFVGGGSPASIVVARSADVPLDAAAFVKALAGSMGGRGGGRPELAQGGLTAPGDEITAGVFDLLGRTTGEVTAL